MADETQTEGPAAPDAAEAARRIRAAVDGWGVYVPPPLPGTPTAEAQPVAAQPAPIAPGELAGDGEDTGWTQLDHLLAREPHNDMGNANRLLRRFGPDLIWVKDVGWHAYAPAQESANWNREQGERHAQIFAHRTAAAINREADAVEAALHEQLRLDEKEGLLGQKPREIEDERNARLKGIDKRVAALRAWGLASGNVAKTSAMLAAAANYRSRDVDDLDAKPDLLAVANGVLEFGAAVDGGIRRRPALREDHITRQTRFVYDPDAECPMWRAFLEQAQPDPEMRGFLQRHVGYALTGHTHEQFVVMHYGGGANGKSTFVETLEWGFGDYSLRLPFASLLRDDRKRGAEATPDLARLPGRRWVIASESEDNVTLSSKTIKDLTERDQMTVRYLNQGFFDFTPQHKLSCMFNMKPNIPSIDDGTWRRLRLVNWPIKFIDPHEAEEHPGAPLKDPTLGARLRAELPGILNWALDGWREWREKGLAPPKSVADATAAYRAESDPVGEFIRAVIHKNRPGKWVPGKQLYRAYKIWAEQSGAPVKTNTMFGKIAKTKLKAETSGIVRYVDIEIDADWWREYGNDANHPD